jgi:hypothetical protein
MICKGTVDSGAKDALQLDPCQLALYTNIDLAEEDSKMQAFLCHFDCFRKLVDDDKSLYIMDSDFSTLGDVWKEQETMGHLLDTLEDAMMREGDRIDLWVRLLKAPKGTWLQLADIVPEGGRTREKLDAIDAFLGGEPRFRDPVIVSWLDDWSAERRSRPEPSYMVLLAIGDELARTFIRFRPPSDSHNR